MNKLLKRILKKSGAINRGAFPLQKIKSSKLSINIKKVLLHPESVKIIAKIINKKINKLDIDSIGGVAIGADVILGALLQQNRHPGFVIRKNPGKKNPLEGFLERGHRVVIVDDVVERGTSIKKAINLVEKAGGKVIKVISVFDYQKSQKKNAEDILGKYDYESIFAIPDFFE